MPHPPAAYILARDPVGFAWLPATPGPISGAQGNECILRLVQRGQLPTPLGRHLTGSLTGSTDGGGVSEETARGCRNN